MKGNKDGIVIIVAIVIIMGLGWDNFKGSYSGSGGGSFFGTSSINNSPQNYEEEKEASTAIEQIQNAEKTVEEIEKKVGELNRSPYYGKFYLYSPAGLGDPDPSKEYFTLNNNLQKNEYVDITGWYFKSTVTNNTAVIGKASTLPFPYIKGTENIVVKQGESIYIIKGFSPINTSFRTNKCTGYFAQDRTFYPYIGRQCPSADDVDLPTFSSDMDENDRCLDYIDRIQVCTEPRNLNKIEPPLPSGCRIYLETKINYNSCVANYKYDSDFAGREWYIYLERFGPLWRNKRETIQLRDREGLLISEVKINY